QGHHLVLAHGERHVAQRLEVLAVREPEALRHMLRLEEHRAGRHVSSPKRVCAQPMRERHTKRFQLTTIMLISAMPPASSGKLAWAVASLIKLPRPLVTRSRPATCMYSATIEPFQAPPAAVTHPVTSAGNAAGRYRDRQRARRGSRNTVAASFNCSGIAATAEITLNRIYHWPANTMSATAPSPSTTPIRWNSRITSGNSMGAGNDATTWITGCSARASRGERPIHTPAGRAHAVDTTTAPITRAKVSAADEASAPQSRTPSWASSSHRLLAPSSAAAATAAITSPAPRRRATGWSRAKRGARQIT